MQIRYLLWLLVSLAAASLVLLLLSVLFSPYRGFSQQQVTLAETVFPMRCTPVQPVGNHPQVNFVDESYRLGKVRAQATTSLTAADFTGNGWDDLLIGTGNGKPQLLVNVRGQFQNRSRMIAHRRADVEWHSHTAIDIDSDGRLDIATAGGGDKGAGTHSRLLRNTTRRGRGLAFANMHTPVQLADQRSRTRAIVPVASGSGEQVDLYASALAREGHPSRYWENSSLPGEVQLALAPAHRLTGSRRDRGNGVFGDFDEDGINDYLVINGNDAELIWGNAQTQPTLLGTQALSAAAGDINNDGHLDVYVGRASPDSDADRLSYNAHHIQVVIKQHNRVDHSDLLFQSELPELQFDLRQSLPRGGRQYPVNGNDIYIGRDRTSPGSRRFTLNKDDAIGRPDNLRKAGIYIWYSDAGKNWHVRWQFQNYADTYRGTIHGGRFANVQTRGFTEDATETVADTLLINNGNGTFTSLCSSALAHTLKTASVTIVDVDNDGWQDIAGVRRGESGDNRGEVFVIRNNGRNQFERVELAARQPGNLSRPDQIVYGFFDDDDKPDIAFTQGFGGIRDGSEPVRLLLNRSGGAHPGITLDLIGSRANTFGVGTRATLRDANGNRLGLRQAGLNANVSQDTTLLHFGLGDTPSPWKLHVQWPDRTVSEHRLDTVGYHRISQPVVN